MKPKLSSKTPDAPEVNSLIDQHAALITHFNSPSSANRHIAIVEYGVDKVTSFEGGDEQATIVTRQIELMVGADQDEAEALLLRVYGKRTGNKVLPTSSPDTPLDMSGVAGVDNDAIFDAADPKGKTAARLQPTK